METNNLKQDKQTTPHTDKSRFGLMAVLKRVPLSIWLKLTFVMLIVSIVVYLISSIKTVVTTTNTTVPDVVKNEKIDVTPTVIRSIEQIGEWSFLEINDEELVDTVRRGIFSNDELVRIYYGTLRLGINLKDAKEGWLSMSGDTLVAKLPPVRLLDNDFIDETRTRSFIASGKWSSVDRKEMYDRAVQKMRQRCLTKKNYAAAQLNAKEQFGQMLRSMGFEKTRVEIGSK